MRGTGPLPKSLQHHSCSPIDIPEMDRFYARYGQKCMNFVRSMTVTREDCSLGPANQVISLIIMIFSLILSRERVSTRSPFMVIEIFYISIFQIANSITSFERDLYLD